MEEELYIVLIKIKSRKAAAVTKYFQKYGKQGNLMTYFFNFERPYINKIQEQNR